MVKPVANQPDDFMEIELDPGCFDQRQPSYAMTNRGELIPCCWLDTSYNRADPDYQELLLASNIDDYDTIEEILLTDEWIKFYKNLKNNKGFPSCHVHCRKRENPAHKREITYVNQEKVKVNTS